jgi:group II intron reverse transcriptase/maturase
VNWVLDADIRGFFDAIVHEWLVKFVKHRIADKRVVRHVKKWLNAGVLEDGEVQRTGEGTPQGGSISPLLANIYLHYALDLWVRSWRRRNANGDMIFVRFADDFVVGFERREEAEKFLAELRERLGRFGLELHPTKTRLIEFGRYAAEHRRRRGLGKPETFTFLGFTHICGSTRKGWFKDLRQTIGKRLRAKLKELTSELRWRLHRPTSEVGEWLKAVLTGHYRYYGVPGNLPALSKFRYEVARLWYRALRRRSQKTTVTWAVISRLERQWLPLPRVMHAYPEQRLRV